MAVTDSVNVAVIWFSVSDNCKNKTNPYDSNGGWGTSEQFQASWRRDMSEHPRCAACGNEYALYSVQKDKVNVANVTFGHFQM